MSWFSKGNASPTEASNDGVVLRDALVVALEYLRDQSGEGRAARVEKLIERLGRFPAPSALVKEVRNIRGELLLSQAGARSGVDGRTVGEVVDSLINLCTSTSLIHSALESRLLAFKGSIPRRVGEEDVAAVIREANDLARAGSGIRRRAQKDREEMSRMLQDMAARLQRADADSARLGAGLEMVAQSLVHQPVPEELANIRRVMVQQIESLTRDAGSLRAELERTRERSEALEEVVRRQAEELVDVRARAAQDPLTGVCNRRTFDKALQQILQRARNTDSPMALVLLDIDHFKRVNDTWGHPAGDAVLVAFAKNIREQIRDDDVVGRYGGEEFGVLLPGAGEAVARSVAERIRESTSMLAFPDPAEGVRVTVSGGVAVMAGNDTPRSILRRADGALYASKHGGRNQVRFGLPEGG